MTAKDRFTEKDKLLIVYRKPAKQAWKVNKKIGLYEVQGIDIAK
jgi:hypothetical protein